MNKLKEDVKYLNKNISEERDDDMISHKNSENEFNIKPKKSNILKNNSSDNDRVTYVSEMQNYDLETMDDLELFSVIDMNFI